MKRMFAMLLSLVCLLSLFAVAVSAEPERKDVYVTIADGQGDLALAQKQVTVADYDGDGILSIYDALFAAHKEYFDGGAAAGFAGEESEWGISLTRLWGVANGGSYGYYLNDQSPSSLLDAIEDGDYISAFVYTDTVAFSDTYCYFDSHGATLSSGEEITLTLLSAGFDDQWNPISKVVANATIWVNGESTSYVTDAEGRVTLQLENAGTKVYTVSAKSEEINLVPPVCTLTVMGADPETSTHGQTDTTQAPDTEKGCKSAIFSPVLLLAVCGIPFALKLKKTKNK